MQAKFFADTGEKRSENWAIFFCRFSPFNFQEKWLQEISRKILHIFHEGRNKILSQRDSRRGVPQNTYQDAQKRSSCWKWSAPRTHLPHSAFQNDNIHQFLTDCSRFLFLSRPGFSRGFCRRVFLLIFVGKSAQKNPPGKSPAKPSKVYTTKIPDTFLQRGRANKFN